MVLNGILFTGGGLDFEKGDYLSDFTLKAKIIFDEAKRLTDSGDYFPIWGTCQGV